MAEHCEVAPGASVAGVQETATDEMAEDGFDCIATDTDAAEDMAGFWTLVAVTVMFPPAAGAVKRPFAVIVPALADHFTAEL